MLMRVETEEIVKGHYNCPQGITHIALRAFWKCESLISITLPEGLKSIGESAFSGCENLTSITLPEGLEEVGEHAFSYCTNLTSVTLPKGLKSIGYSAFYDCKSLNSVAFPKGLEKIEHNAFLGCEQLSSILFLGGPKKIENRAFAFCSRLTSVVMHGGIDTIPYGTFHKCNNLTTIFLYNKQKVTKQILDAFSECKNFNHIIIDGSPEIEMIPDSLKTKVHQLSFLKYYLNTKEALGAHFPVEICQLIIKDFFSLKHKFFSDKSKEQAVAPEVAVNNRSCTLI